MRIRRVFLDGVGPLSGHSAGMDMGRHTRGALCLRGPNGCGKSTWLRAAQGLWLWLRRSATRRRPARLQMSDPGYPDGATAGMLLDGLPGAHPRLWLWQGSAERWLTEVQATGEDAPVLISDTQYAGAVDAISEADLREWEVRYVTAEAGMGDCPNMALVDAESRYLPALKRRDLDRPGRSPAWIVGPRYVPAEGMDPLEAVMRSLALAMKPEWALLQGLVPRLLPGLELRDDFDPGTQRPVFQLHSGPRLTAEQLSAGEKALLITLVTLLRFGSPGGVVLLDEPELHQHLSLMRGALAAVEDLVVRQRGGQLIVASHSPEVWAHFPDEDATIELPGRRG